MQTGRIWRSPANGAHQTRWGYVGPTWMLHVFLPYVLKSPLFGLENSQVDWSVGLLPWAIRDPADPHVQGDGQRRALRQRVPGPALSTVTWIFSLILCVLFLYHSGTHSLLAL